MSASHVNGRGGRGTAPAGGVPTVRAGGEPGRPSGAAGTGGHRRSAAAEAATAAAAAENPGALPPGYTLSDRHNARSRATHAAAPEHCYGPRRRGSSANSARNVATSPVRVLAAISRP